MSLDTLAPNEFAGATIVFDLDGTLVDTAPDLVRALNSTLAHEGLPTIRLSQVRNIVGHGARALIVKGAAFWGVRFTDSKLDELTETFVSLYAADIATASRPFPNVVKALDRCAILGAKLAICTNKRTGLAIALLDALGLTPRFSAIVGPEGARARKPSPDHFIAAVERAGGDIHDCVMIGDSEADLRSARAAGAPVALVKFGYGMNIEALEPDAILTDFAHAPQIIGDLRRMVATQKRKAAMV